MPREASSAIVAEMRKRRSSPYQALIKPLSVPTVSARRGEGRFGKPEILKLLFSLAGPLCMVLVYLLNTRDSQSTPLCNVNYGVSLIDQAVIRFKETVPNKPEHTAMEAWTTAR